MTRIEHSWNPTPDEAIALQIDLASRVRQTPLDVNAIHTVAGVDVAYDDEHGLVAGGVVVLEYDTHRVIDESLAFQRQNQAYQPGLFSFRELPVLLEAIDKLETRPDVFVCDGHGLNHPRFFGLACHLGILRDVPTIGCAKKRFVGRHPGLGEERGSRADIAYEGILVGSALRTQTGIKPLYVSVGHLCTLENACEIVLSLADRYRLPETTREADQRVRVFLTEVKEKDLEGSPKERT